MWAETAPRRRLKGIDYIKENPHRCTYHSNKQMGVSMTHTMPRDVARDGSYPTASNDERNRRLVDYSPGDKPWDQHRSQSDDVADIYATADDLTMEKLARRMSKCSGLLHFGWVDDTATGESKLKLRDARFCRVRYCPVCQWRRQLMWKAKFLRSLPGIIEQYPKARWIMLTLTVRNCRVDELRGTLQSMNAGWQRLKQRRDFRPVHGWIRTTEITRGRDGSAHPHFHSLLMVPPSMLSGPNYIKHSRWVELWQQALRLNYAPNVDVRVVKSKRPKPDQTAQDAAVDSVSGGVMETLKYTIKPGDMIEDPDWFVEMTRQTHKLRFVATGGALKHVLKDTEETDESMAMTDTDAPKEGEDDGVRIGFGWRPSERQYRRRPKADKTTPYAGSTGQG